MTDAKPVDFNAPLEVTFPGITDEIRAHLRNQDEAYARGFDTADLLSNPYPDGSAEARRFVDGWVDGRKWKA